MRVREHHAATGATGFLVCAVLVLAPGCTSPAPSSRASRPLAMTAIDDVDAGDAAPSPASPLRFEATAALVSDPALATQVDALATSLRIEGQVIGVGGRTSDVWLLANDINTHAPRATRLALLRHESVVVRGYVAAQLLVDVPDATDAVWPLFTDTTRVESIDGCLGAERSLAEQLVHTLPERVATRATLAARLARDPHVVPEARAHALGLLAGAKAHDAAVALRTDATPVLRHAALRALAQTGDPSDLELVTPSLRSVDAGDRQATLQGLVRWKTKRASDLVEPLLADPDREVRRYAARAYGANPSASTDRLTALLASDEARDVAMAITARGGDSALALLEAPLMRDPSPVDPMDADAVFAQAGASSVPRLRRLLGSANPRTRAPVITALVRLNDRASLAAIRPRVRSADLFEMQAACATVATWGVSDAAADLTSRLHDENAHAGIAAAKALASLHAREAVPELEKEVAARKGHWSEAELRAALTKLKSR